MHKKPLVIIRTVQNDNVKNVVNVVKEIMNLLNWEDLIKEETRVLIKLNLSSIEERFLKASNTDKKIIEAVVTVLKKKTNKIVLIESDGMRYSAEEAFRINGIYELAERMNISVINLSNEKHIYGLHPLLEDFGIPEILLSDNSILITLPVLKTHAITAISGALKNQWGCIPRYDRILLHKNLDILLPFLNKLLRPQIAIMDGIWCMEGRGPTSGKPRYLGIILGSRFPASLDAVAMRLIGLDPHNSKHLVLSSGEELGSIKEEDIVIEGKEIFEKYKVHFEPAKLDWVLRLMNYMTRSKFFVYKILLNNNIFKIGKIAVNILRNIGIVR